MKRAIPILLSFALLLALCACGSKFNAEDELRQQVDSDVRVYCVLKYDVKLLTTTITDVSQSGDKYTVKGKVNITDNYGDKYEGKITATYTLKGETFSRDSLDVETPKKK